MPHTKIQPKTLRNFVEHDLREKNMAKAKATIPSFNKTG
jgi:hypothetical protein